jgi:hypothetical protein
MGTQLLIVDDNPHVAWQGRVYPVNATFQQFAAALLDLPGSPVATITSCVPLREAAADAPPGTRALDPRIRIVGTTPFDGIEGYLRHLPAMLRANRPILRGAIAGADLVWLKVPASNAALAAAIAVQAGVPRFVWAAGSAADVAGARYAGAAAFGAGVVGLGYDLVGRLAAAGGDRVVVGRGLDGDGIVTSLVEADELRDPAERRWPASPDVLRLAWAGRLARGKGLEALLPAVAELAGVVAPRRVELTLIGDGPAGPELRAIAGRLGLDRATRFTGYIAERRPYLDMLATADAFVFPSEAEGFPKVILDAMAVGLPVFARPAGSLAQLDPAPFVRLGDLTATVRSLDAAGPGSGWSDVAARGHAFAASHTRQAEVTRLVARWQARWPGLPWA